MYSNTDEIKKDYKELLVPYTEAINAYNGYLKTLTNKENFKQFFTTDNNYNILKVLNKNVNDFQPKIDALKTSITDSCNQVENPIYTQYFLGSLDKWSDIVTYINITFNNLSDNLAVAKKELAENKMEGLLEMLDRDFDNCKQSLSDLFNRLDMLITDIQYIHRFDELDVTDYNID